MILLAAVLIGVYALSEAATQSHSVKAQSLLIRSKREDFTTYSAHYSVSGNVTPSHWPSIANSHAKRWKSNENETKIKYASTSISL